MKQVFDLKNSVSGILSGLDLTNVTNLNGALERGSRVLCQKADIPEASGIQNIILYSGVFDYLCDPRIFGTAIVDIRPQGISRQINNFVFKNSREQFDRQKQYVGLGTTSTFEYYNGVPIIRIRSNQPQQNVILDPMTAVNSWLTSGSASTLAQDTAVYYQAPASLRFTLTGSSTGAIYETINAINLSSYQGVGMAFLAIQIPPTVSASTLSSITLTIGSTAVTATQGFLGNWVNNDWLLVAFDFSTVAPGSWSAVTNLNVSFTTTGTIQNMRVGGLWICQPSPAQIVYQSNAIWLPVGSQTPSTTITANTDSIILNDAAYTILEFECALSILQQTGGGASDGTMSGIESTLNGARTRTGVIITEGLYDLYRGDNPSQELRSLGSYYEDGGGYGNRSRF